MATKRIDTTDLDVGQHTHIDIPGTGVLDRTALNEEGIEVVDGMGFDDYARELAFMEEKVDVEMHESTDPNASPIEDVYCQGVVQRFLRGHTQTVKRKYVQILANARPVSMRTEIKKEDDDVINRVHKTSALRYPFSVMRDDNPRGREWLKKALRAI